MKVWNVYRIEDWALEVCFDSERLAKEYVASRAPRRYLIEQDTI